MARSGSDGLRCVSSVPTAINLPRSDHQFAPAGNLIEVLIVRQITGDCSAIDGALPRAFGQAATVDCAAFSAFLQQGYEHESEGCESSQTLGSLSDHLDRLRWRLAPQARSRLSRGRRQPTVSRALEQPLTARRLERFKADAKDHLRRAEEPAAARINQPLASGAQAVATSGDRQFADQTAPTPSLAISSGIRAWSQF